MEPTPAPDSSVEFRWQAFFQRSRDPLFLLNRQRRILFVNRAWEALTGLRLSDVRGLVCTRRKPAAPSPTDLVTRALCPPPEVLEGRSAHIRRGSPQSGSFWDIVFLPFHDENRLLGILGRIEASPGAINAEQPLSENLQTLRAKRAQRYRLETLQSTVPVMQRAVEQARMATQVSVPVLIVGEIGTGKRWLARAIHQLGPRREEPLAVIDCARLSAEHLQFVLFGERGLVSSGRAGTVFLRDPERLPRDLQSRFLEALTEGQPRTPRLIAGSTSDLQPEARSLRVLEDFRCRLSTLVIELPPLRARMNDFSALVELFLDLACQRQKSKQRSTLTTEALDLLQAYSWPGNLQELADMLWTASERASGERISPSELPSHLRLAGQSSKEPQTKADQPLPLETILEEAERRLIQIALRRTNGNKTRAAELLGLWKPRLLRRMAALGLKDT